MKDNSNRNEINAGKPAYESMTCSILEVETQGVLCASNSPSELVYGLSQQQYTNGGTL